ncbi:bifunctional 2-polyprenyl-6-hydroxyphenol methylase/3-demethylubiquinol 3-O-methyltransferase UbiG [Agromyces sp. SYSU T00266]|uniref:bifunctional 2-polyprenyl-6-hydroxyphenol methylase/3-demethylubiquinol 3-O-methyltransferase UbiG n=1 Tax=Agromyces zhanjiangensis TaxID=3158562 RepID=UPI00339A5C31
MGIDNDVYDRLGATWWDEDNPLNVLHGSFTPARMRYFRRVLSRVGISRGRLLDVGCGAGFLSEEFARSGFTVSAIDPSPVAIAAARAHAEAGGLAIDYRLGRGEQLPFADASVDVATSCDVLEHVADLGRVIAEVARVLRPGGVFLYDTINRTRRSRLLVIRAMQEWRWTRITDAEIHDWAMFITPAELSAVLDDHGLAAAETVGLAPRASLPNMVRDLLRTRRGRMSFGELSRRLDFGEVQDVRVSYLGYAVRSG